MSELGLTIRFDVFISHASEDIALVNDFSDLLRWNNINPLVAEHFQEPGLLLWKDKIKSLIKRSRFFVVLYTYNAQNKPKVHQEIGSAGILDKRIIVLLEQGIDQGSLPGYLEGIEVVENFTTFNSCDVLTNITLWLLRAQYPSWRNIIKFYGLDKDYGKVQFKFDDVTELWNKYRLDSKSGSWVLMQ